MEALLYIVFCACLFWLVKRLYRDAQVIRQQHGHSQNPSAPSNGDNRELRWVAPVEDVDTVCGKTVTTERAKPSVYAGRVYYFCSRECREVFEAAPDFYVGSGTAGRRKLEHSHA